MELPVARILGVCLAVRVLGDLAHGVGGGGLAVGFSGLTVLVALGLVLREGLAGRRPTGWLPVALFAAVLLQAADPSLDTVRSLMLYLGPPALFLVAARWGNPGWGWRWSRGLAIAATVPLAWNLAAWLSGQPAANVLNDYPRLLGGYASPHAHAVAMAVFVSIGLLWAEGGRGRERGIGAALLVAAATCLLLTWVRTALLMVSVQAAVYLWLRGRRRWVLLGSAPALVLALSIPGVADRFSDIGRVLSGTAPPDGWSAIGSFRIGIWADMLTAFVEHGVAAWGVGLGLGEHHSLHRGLDPHNDVLTLLFQAGVLAPVLWYAVLGRAGWASRPIGDAVRGDAFRAHAVAWAVAVAVCAPLSNDVLSRVTLGWWVFAALGAASGKDEPRSDGGGQGNGEVVVDPSGEDLGGGAEHGSTQRHG